MRIWRNDLNKIVDKKDKDITQGWELTKIALKREGKEGKKEKLLQQRAFAIGVYHHHHHHHHQDHHHYY